VTRIEGAYAVVTGGSSGIGLACAEALAAAGAHVGMIARNPARLAQAHERVWAARRSPDQRVTSASADVGDFQQVREAIASLDSGGTPDIIINSAGIFVPGYFQDMEPELFRQHLDINVMGVINTAKLVAPGMIARGSGSIVNVASVAGYIGVFGYTAYSTAKFAVIGFSETLRQEMRPHGVGVHVVCPPDVDTPGLAVEKSLRPPETERIAGAIKAISPEKVAAAVLKGIANGRYMIIPDISSSFYYRLKGIVPELFYAVFDRDVRKARRARGV
jgi:3-dehydrosphinganine reductase